MKKKVGLLLLIIVFAFSSCSLQYTFEFVNESSYIIYIQPNGQDWDSFYLDVDDDRSVTINESTIYFIYDHAGLVGCDNSEKGKIIFTDK